MEVRGAQELADEGLDDGRLVARGQVRQLFAGTLLTQLLQLVEQARLEAGEAEVQVVSLSQGDGEVVSLSVPTLRGSLQRRSPGEAEAKHSRPLVEGLPRGVVEGLSEEVHLVAGAHGVEGGVTAGGDQGHERRLDRKSTRLNSSHANI